MTWPDGGTDIWTDRSDGRNSDLDRNFPSSLRTISLIKIKLLTYFSMYNLLYLFHQDQPLNKIGIAYYLNRDKGEILLSGTSNKEENTKVRLENTIDE